MSKNIRRLIAGGVAIVLATVGVEVTGTVAASAHNNAVTPVATCNGATGTYTVVWTVANDYNETETVTPTAHTPVPATVSPGSVALAANGSGILTESQIPGDSTSATLTINGVWDGDNYSKPNSGSINLGGSCLPNHSPAVPSATTGKCVSQAQANPTITIPSDSGVTYKLDGVIKPSGSYPVLAGTHHVVASSITYALTGTTDFAFDLTAAPSDCNDTVVPHDPTVVQATCTTDGSGTSVPPTITAASTTGITYQLTPSGAYSGGQNVTVTATATAGFEFTSPAPSGWTLVDSTHETFAVTFNAVPACNTTATPAAPTLRQSACVASGSPSAPTLTEATTSGITYSVSTSAPYTGGQNVVVTATANSGFQFVAPAPSGWTFVNSTQETHSATFDATPICVAAVNPSLTQSACHTTGTTTTAPALDFATTSGITYSATPAAPYSAGQTVTMTATAGSGHEFFTTPPSGWTYVDSTHETHAVTFDAAPKCAEPAMPAFANAACVNFAPTASSFTVPTTVGVDYLVNNQVVPAGTYPAIDGSFLTVTTQAQAGYTLTGTDTFTHTFAVTPSCTTTVTPVQPSFSDSVCNIDYAPTTATYTIPATVGVDYLVDGQVTPAGTYNTLAGATVSITTQAQLGYQLSGTTEFTHIFAVQPICKTTVTPLHPSFSDSVCDLSYEPTPATYTIPLTAGVDYLVGGLVKTAGSYDATSGTTVSITAQAQPGFTLTGTTTFDHTFPAIPTCTTTVTTVSPVFTDSVCTGAGTSMPSTYSIPVVAGVEYLVNGTVKPAGDYVVPAGSTATVTVAPLPGFSLAGTLTWSHTYPAELRCLSSKIPAAAKFSDDVCTGAGISGASYTIPASEGVVYSVEGATIDAGTYPATDGTTVTAVATAKAGYTLTGITQWTHTFSGKPTCSDIGGVTAHRPLANHNSGTNSATASQPTATSTASTGVPVGQVLLTGIALLLMGVACFAGAATRRRGQATT